MYLSDIKISGYRLFEKEVRLQLKKGLNVLVGENGCGKSTVIDAIRLLCCIFTSKNLLAIGIPKTKTFSNEDRKMLVEAGFEIVEC